ncbi:peptidoglycan-binding domain-containing protein [Marinobacter sp.]|uniref:peptidoglycan-binding domain-containing protein n=1 Tax=Marinobacter sp. TaxID=50741 RepID=UPI0035676021
MKTVTRRLGKTLLLVGAVALLGSVSVAQANDVVALKHALYGAGYNISDVRPSMDDNTRSELVRFQKDQGLEANGILTEETKKALGMVPVQQTASSGGGAASSSSVISETVEAASEAPKADQTGEKNKEKDEGWSLW